MWLAMLQFERKLQVLECIGMGINTFKNFHLGRYIVDIRSEITFNGSVGRPRKTKFRPYIRRYTSPNENFKYSYPLIEKHEI